MKMINSIAPLSLWQICVDEWILRIQIESTPLNKLAVADAAWARMPVDNLNMTLAWMKSYKSAKEWRLYIKFETYHTIWTNTKGREPNSASALASQPVAGHSLSFYYYYCFMTLGWGQLVRPAAESCSRIKLQRLSHWLAKFFSVPFFVELMRLFGNACIANI